MGGHLAGVRGARRVRRGGFLSLRLCDRRRISVARLSTPWLMSVVDVVVVGAVRLEAG